MDRKEVIKQILESRRKLSVATKEELVAEVKGEKVSALSTAPGEQETLPAPTVTDDVTVEAWLDAHLPALSDKAAALFKPPFAWQELTDFATTVSKAVAEGLPLIKGAEAKALVSAIVLVLFNRLAAPHVPVAFAWLVRQILPMLVQFVYDTFVKPRLKKAN